MTAVERLFSDCSGYDFLWAVNEKTFSGNSFVQENHNDGDEKKSRREFLKTGAALASRSGCVGADELGARQARLPGSGRRAEQFNYADVQLLDGPMLEQFKQNHALFLNLNEDSLLKPFRQLAGRPRLAKTWVDGIRLRLTSILRRT